MSDATNSFTVVCQKSGREVQVPPDQSILQALLDAGLLPDHLCTKGRCGTCETRVLACDGELVHRDGFLTPGEHAAGKSMMICVSRCTGTRLALDI
ncbi:MAG: 2Fe-2S iron-sulfur cluster binding domain-containing protein [Burkholderiaceae bacterium]|nr:2Fe-2S iron-sulfur cluster binding domain-containing protein [Burkholderiaceae bacterium]